MHRQTVEFLSPCFCHGADPRGPAELRVPSLRGQLRFWARVLAHDPDEPSAATKFEHQLFGGMRGALLRGVSSGKAEPVASLYVVRLTGHSPMQSKEDLCPHAPGKAERFAWPARSKLDVEWGTSDRSAGEGTEEEFRRVLKAWLLLGGLGGRLTRAAGSVWRCDKDPTETEYIGSVKDLFKTHKIPDWLLVKVLPRWETVPELKSYRFLHPDPQQRYREIATNTIDAQPLWHGALGSAKPRRTSPLKLKLGRFKGDNGEPDFRLIAIGDGRNGRQGDRIKMIEDLINDCKPLGFLLRQGGVR